MRKTSWITLACVLACSDTIGAEVCQGSACDSPEFMLEALNIEFTKVPTGMPSPMPAYTWSVPNACTTCDPNDVAQIFAARGDGVFRQVRGVTTPTLQRIAGDGALSPPEALTLPAGASGLVAAHAVGLSTGQVLVHALWSQPGTSQVMEEMARFTDSPVERRTLRALPQANRQLGAIPANTGGYLLYDHDLARGDLIESVRQIGDDGAQQWLRGRLPEFVPYVGGSAVWSGQQYVLPARSPAATNPAYYMLWFGPDGTLQRGTSISGSNWRNARLQDGGNGVFASVAQSDLESGASAGGANEGNIDVVVFRGSEPSAAWRLLRECIYRLEVHGSSLYGSGGVVFVSSLVGTADDPRGMLCRLEADVVPRCWQTAAREKLGALVAIGPNSVVAVMNDQIVRIDLP